MHHSSSDTALPRSALRRCPSTGDTPTAASKPIFASLSGSDESGEEREPPSPSLSSLNETPVARELPLRNPVPSLLDTRTSGRYRRCRLLVAASFFCCLGLAGALAAFFAHSVLSGLENAKAQ